MGALEEKKGKNTARIVDFHSFECSISVVFWAGVKTWVKVRVMFVLC